MKTIFRPRNIIEEMDFQLAGDRPVDYFLLTQEEFDQFVKNGMYELYEPAASPDGSRHYKYKGIRIVVAS